jgi:hypothetical protein
VGGYKGDFGLYSDTGDSPGAACQGRASPKEDISAPHVSDGGHICAARVQCRARADAPRGCVANGRACKDDLTEPLQSDRAGYGCNDKSSESSDGPVLIFRSRKKRH